MTNATTPTTGFAHYCQNYSKQCIDQLYKKELTVVELDPYCYDGLLEASTLLDNMREEQNEPLLDYISGGTGLSVYGCIITELSREFLAAIKEGTFSLISIGAFLKSKDYIEELLAQFGEQNGMSYTTIAAHVRVTLSFTIDIVDTLGCALSEHLNRYDPASLEHYIVLREEFCKTASLTALLDGELDNYLIDNDVYADFIGDYSERTTNPFSAITSTIQLCDTGDATARVVWCNSDTFVIEVYYNAINRYRDCVMGSISKKDRSTVHMQIAKFQTEPVKLAIANFLRVGGFTLAPKHTSFKAKN